jgi:hypothetical protein
MEQLAEAGTELAVGSGAADLEEIGAAAGSSHLLGFVHATVEVDPIGETAEVAG